MTFVRSFRGNYPFDGDVSRHVLTPWLASSQEVLGFLPLDLPLLSPTTNPRPPPKSSLMERTLSSCSSPRSRLSAPARRTGDLGPLPATLLILTPIRRHHPDKPGTSGATGSKVRLVVPVHISCFTFCNTHLVLCISPRFEMCLHFRSSFNISR